MRKILLLLCLFLFANAAHGQNPANGQYRLTIEFDKFVNTANNVWINYRVWTTIGSEEHTLNVSLTGDKINKNRTVPSARTSYLYKATQRPGAVKTHIQRVWTVFLGRKSSNDYNQKTISRTTPYVDITVSTGDDGYELFRACHADMHIMLYPEKIDIGYYNSDGKADGKNFLSDVDPITLKATDGFVSTTYNWQYSIGGGAWIDFPSSMQNKSAITFKGTDIIPIETYKSLVRSKTNIRVRINALTDKGSNILTLSPRISAPHITDAVIQQLETCYGEDDAKIRITFDRPLIDGEIIAVKIDNMIPYGGGFYSALDDTNSIVIENVEAGNRTFTVAGTAEDNEMYTGSAAFSKTVALPHRPKIIHEVIGIRAVSCHGGSDGEIVIDAAGGNGNFIAKLYLAAEERPIREIAFTESETTSFDRLTAGNYEIRVHDTNGCTAYAANGSVLVHQVAVIEPAKPVTVSLEHMTSPLAHDSHDGKFTIRVGGGTRIQNGYTVVLTLDGIHTYAPARQSIDGSDVLYTFEGLPQGDCSVSIQDKNYASLDPQDQVDPCGCCAALNFYLDAPPPLVVEIEESHYINWHGGNQGELTAHADGGVRFAAAMPYQYSWYKQSDAGVMQPYAMLNDSIARNLTAGIYQIKVTDANGISKTSAIYELLQPDPIEVQFTIVQTGCQGGSSGKVAAQVGGGVEPYTYQWNVEGASGAEIASLEAGKYILKITDARGGQLLANAEVGSASKLVIDSVVVQPTCLSLGSIRLQLSGATPPYAVVWDDTGSGGLSRDELMPGTYRVSVTDANNCIDSFVFDLKEPRGFTVDLGPDLVMCRNQTRVVEAVCAEPQVGYEWFRDGEKLADTENRITVDRQAVYSVRATNALGCYAVDQLNVRMINETLELDMTVPTKVEVGSEIHAVNLSDVAADRIVWILPEEAVIVSQTDLETVFTLDRKGTYTVSMEGFRGEGATIVTRQIEIVDKGEVTLPDDKNPMIKQFWVTPNPSTGYFKVVVELDQAGDFTMILYSPQGVEMDRKESSGVQSKTFEYEINGTLQGVYSLQLLTKTDKSVLQIEIKK